MKCAVCRIQQDRVVALEFEREYNRLAAQRFTVFSFEEASAALAQYDHIDIVVPAAATLYLAGAYPAVPRPALERIIAQDIEATTPFKESEVVFDLSPLRSDGAVPVFVAQKKDLRAIIDRSGAPLRDRVRSLIPETALVIGEGEGMQGLFIDDDQSVLFGERGQVVRTTGLSRLIAMMRSSLGGAKTEDEVLQTLAAAMDLSDGPALSEDELLMRKAAEQFFQELVAEFGRFMRRDRRTVVCFADRLPGNAEKLIVSAIPGAMVISAEDALTRIFLRAEQGESPSFSRGEFVYRGGFNFLKKRILLAAALFALAFVLMITAFELRLWYLGRALDALDEQARTVTKEILGKEYPSLRQALSVMQKTIGGGSRDGKDTKGDKRLYPYSSLFIMEQVFPLASFEGSTIELKDLSIKDGKVKLTGEAESLDHINTLLEQLEKMEYATELNKGQITSRGEKNSFNIGFTFQKRSAKEHAKKEKDKDKDKGKEKEKEKVSPTEQAEADAPKNAPPPVERAEPSRSPARGPEPAGKETVPWEEEL
ncbi:MAG TPA: hypothetical protein P5077_01445 [bacterium]|nr:hypothetical protein [bacterium]